MRSVLPVSIVVFLFATVALAAGEAPKAAAAKAPAVVPAPPAPTPDAQVAALEAQCAKSSEARTKRHAEKPLFERLGGEEKIHALTREVVRLHRLNKNISHFLADGEDEALAKHVAQFMIGATGGPNVYKGPSLTESHAHLKLTNADFMSAGGDIIQAMKNLGYGENEVDEVVCALVGLRDQVVLPKNQVPQKP